MPVQICSYASSSSTVAGSSSRVNVGDAKNSAALTAAADDATMKKNVGAAVNAYKLPSSPLR